MGRLVEESLTRTLLHQKRPTINRELEERKDLVLMKRKALLLTFILTILVLTTLAVLFAEKPNPSSFNNSDQNTVFIASFSPELYGNNVIGGDIVLVNPTNRYFDNLNLTTEVDDFKLIVPRLLLAVGGNLSRSVPVTGITIDPYQNETLRLFFGILDRGTFSSYFGGVQISAFSSHVIKFYVSQNNFGDVINSQSLAIPQKKAYLQILGYSSIEHDNDTWHEYYNSTRNRYEYVNDQPNFYQQYHHSAFFPLDPNSYNWAKGLNQLGEHYFNVTIFNNILFQLKELHYLRVHQVEQVGWNMRCMTRFSNRMRPTYSLYH